MTSKQIMLILTATFAFGPVAALTGCHRPQRMPASVAPYETRQVFAVAPLRNESGSRFADGTRLADKLTQQLALARGLETLPVNRVLSAMEALGLPQVTRKADALRLREVLGVDGLLVGSITAYEPYDPPRLGLNLELYHGGPPGSDAPGLDTRGLSAAASPQAQEQARQDAVNRQPVTAWAGFFDAADPRVLDLLDAYTVERGPDGTGEMTTRRYLISIDLYSEFVSHRLVQQLLEAERLRLRQPSPHNTRRPRTSPAT